MSFSSVLALILAIIGAISIWMITVIGSFAIGARAGHSIALEECYLDPDNDLRTLYHENENWLANLDQ